MKVNIRLTLFLLLSIIIGAWFTGAVYAKEIPGQKNTAVSFALDISGSMKKTDKSGLTVNLLELFIDSLSDSDYVSVTIYNDNIVYNSGLVLKSDKDKIDDLKNTLDNIQYHGDTDNGLALKTATENLVSDDVDLTDYNKFVMLITDGDTDIPSGSDRTLADSNQDLKDSAKLAAANNVAITAIEYTEKYMQDTSALSVITSSTKGSTTLVNDEKQFVEVMFNTFYSNFRGENFELKYFESDDLMHSHDVVFEDSEKYDYDWVVLSLTPISEMQVFNGEGPREYDHGEKYILIQSAEEKEEEIQAYFSFSKPAAYFIGKTETLIPVIIETPEPTPQVIYVEPSKEPEVIATPEPEPVVEETFLDKYLTWIIVGVIGVIAICICVIIIKKVLFPPKKMPEIKGFLDLCFIDLKSKNETRDIRWNLSEYPAEGVTLQELFKGIGLQESLKDLDKICFYPSEKYGELTFVHCMEGGIFKGDVLLKKNKAVALKDGDTLFISFSENASEISLTYYNG